MEAESAGHGERNILKLSHCRRCDAFWYPQDYSACPNCRGVRATRVKPLKEAES